MKNYIMLPTQLLLLIIFSCHTAGAGELDVEGTYKEGVRLRKSGKFEDAAVKFEEVIKLQDPSFVVQALHNLGSIAYTRKRYDDAAVFFYKATKTNLKINKKEFTPSLNNLKKLSNDKLISKGTKLDDLNLARVDSDWARTFVLKDGSTIAQEQDAVIIGDNIRVGGKFVSAKGNFLNGLEIKNMPLILSSQMSYADFVRTMVVCGIFEDKPGNWLGKFFCKENVVIAHHPTVVVLYNGGQITKHRNLTLNNGPDVLTGDTSYENFVRMLQVAGLL